MKWKVEFLMLPIFMLIFSCSQVDPQPVETKDTGIDTEYGDLEDASESRDSEEENSKDEPAGPTFHIVEDYITLAAPRQKTHLQVVAMDEDGLEVVQPDVQWKSSHSHVATINNQGEVSAVAPGSATITGIWNGMEDVVQVFVKKVHALEIKPGGHEILAGDSVALKVHYFSEDGEELFPPHAVVQWIANVPEVARITHDGILVANAGGTVKVQARSEHQVAEETFYVDVRYVDISCNTGSCCMVSTLNQLYCWGDSLISPLLPGSQPKNYPERVESPVLFQSVHVAYLGACALDFQGSPWCWGTEVYGRLGTGEVSMSAVHVPQKVNAEVPFIDVITLAYGTYFLDEEGKLYALGAWPPGDVMDPEIAIDVHLSPTLIDDGPWTRFEDVRFNTLCIHKEGSVYCIGNNDRKVFGYGKDAPLQYNEFVPWGEEAGMVTVIGESTSAFCGLDQEGYVWCAGESNGNGIFGYEMEGIETGFIGPHHYFVARTSWDIKFSRLHRGQSFFCGEMSGHLACWGPNNGCQLGWDPEMPAFVGMYQYSYFPIWTKHPPFSKVSLAADSVCLLSEEGKLSCWGLATNPYLQPLQYGGEQYPDGCEQKVLPVTAYERPGL